MVCRSPMRQYPKPGGGYTFNHRGGFSPRSYRELPCGNCRDCRVRRTREWAIRCSHEASLHRRNCTVTPTYEIDPVTLSRRDIQIFFKRLRRRVGDVRYFGCGEYGEKFNRPHWHVCLFGIDFEFDRYPWKKTSAGTVLYRSPTLEECWRWGHILIDPKVTSESARYTAGYVQKKINGDMAEGHYVREHNGMELEVTPEFGIMSRNPAIGRRWIEKFWKDVYPADCVIWNGRECGVPRYYDKWLEDNQPEVWKEVREKREKFARNQVPESELRREQAALARDCRYDRGRRDYEAELV